MFEQHTCQQIQYSQYKRFIHTFSRMDSVSRGQKINTSSTLNKRIKQTKIKQILPKN